MPKKITVAYAAQLYGITPRGMRDLLNQRKAPGEKKTVGGKDYWDIDAQDFLFYLKRRRDKRNTKTQKLESSIQELEQEIRR